MKKVLLVSASKSLLSRNISFLEDKGFQFLTASSGVRALQLHDKNNFDLILCDMELEDMDGCRFCCEVRNREIAENVPIVFICYETAESIAKAKQGNVSAILLRPINPTQLLITIGSFIDMSLARSKRVIFTVPVLSKAGDAEFGCNSRDISVSGILIETEHHLELGSRITCHFTLPDAKRIEPGGEVARYFISDDGKKCYGVKFTDLHLSSRRAIENYVVSNDDLGVKPTLHYQLERSSVIAAMAGKGVLVD